MKLTILAIKMLLVAALFIISNQNLYMSISEDRQVFYDFYSNWIQTLFHQAFEVSGYVVKFEWLPTNNGSVSSYLRSDSQNISSD